METYSTSTKSVRIAYLDDQGAFRDLVKRRLEHAGFHVRAFNTPWSFLAHVRDSLSGGGRLPPDLVILDYYLDQRQIYDGQAVLIKLRQELDYRGPILFLSVLNNYPNQERGYGRTIGSGADELVAKDNWEETLIPKINSLLNRRLDQATESGSTEAIDRQSRASDIPPDPATAPSGSAPLIHGGLHLDPENCRSSWQGRTLDLTGTEIRIVASLANAPGRLSRLKLAEEAGLRVRDEEEHDPRSVDSHLKRIRRKFRSVDPDFRCIVTRYGEGYEWIARDRLRIAAVDDNANSLELTRKQLEAEGFEVIAFRSPVRFLEEFETVGTSLAILDILMDEMDGREVCRELRKRNWRGPVLFLTTLPPHEAEREALELGANAFLDKAIQTTALVPRVRTLLRGVGSPCAVPARQAQATGTPLDIDRNRRTCSWRGKPVELTKTEFSIVAQLSANPGRPISRVEILEKLRERKKLESRNFGSDATRRVDTHIKRVRQKFKAVDPEFSSLRSQYSEGYLWRDNE